MRFNLMDLSAEELDELIGEAAKRRAELEPKVSTQPPDPWTAQGNPAWSVSLVEQGSLLRIRHTGLGWICFVIPAQERAVLLTALLQHALLARADLKVTIKGSGGEGDAAVPGGSLH